MNYLLNLSYIGNFLGGLAGLLALIIALVQLRGLRKSVQHSNLMSIFEVEFELNRRKEKYADFERQALEFLNDRDVSELNDDEKKAIKWLKLYRTEALENYLNIFDRIAYFILKKQFEEEDFRLEYRDMLFHTIENKLELFGTGTSYNNMRELYDKWKKR